jgi:aminopeptidase N
MRLPFLLLLLLWLGPSLSAQADFFAQRYRFTLADSLRGSLRPERTCYDVTHYDLRVRVDLATHSLSGHCRISFRARIGFNLLQLDLFDNLYLDSIVHQGRKLPFFRKAHAVFVDFGAESPIESGAEDAFTVYYHGQPLAAENPPWDGGFVWSEDEYGRPWVGVSCQGIGASLWWPNKDHLSDEPDSMRISCEIRDTALQAVCNGRLLGRRRLPDGWTAYDWAVGYPINNYDVTLNIARYAHFSDEYTSPFTEERLALHYYVLEKNLAKAKKQFQQVHEILRIFEKFTGPYPFWRDGYKLVETPYVGMEHQSAIAYGNRFVNGYLGSQPPGVDFDYIIVHETGHEWFGNSLSCNDLSEMWLHESFTTYLESVFVEEKYGYATMLQYINYFKPTVANKQPMRGPDGVNFEDHGTDIYYKGALMLNTLRHCLQNDTLWWGLFKSFHQQHLRGHATTEDFISLVNERSGRDFRPFFEQYLNRPHLPLLEYRLTPMGKQLEVAFRWTGVQADFSMPVEIGPPGQWQRVVPRATEWQSVVLPKCKPEEFRVATDKWLIKTKYLK